MKTDRVLSLVFLFWMITAASTRGGTTLTFVPENVYVYSPVINDAGAIAFQQDSGTGTSMLWSGSPQSPIKVANQSGGLIDTFEGVSLNANGAVAYAERTSATTNALFAGVPGAIQTVAADGQNAAGTGAGVVFARSAYDSQTFHIAAMNSSGIVAFSANLTGTGVTTSNNSGIWVGSASGLQLVARTGAVAPGTDASTAFLGLLTPQALNSSNQVAFVASLTGSNVTSSNQWGIWAGSAGSLALIARTGAPAPGASSGVTFASLNTTATEPLLNAAGEIAFAGGMAGSGITSANQNAIWAGQPNQLSMVVQAGIAAPSTDASTVFASFGDVMVNSPGNIAFWAKLAGPTVSGSNQTGYWAGPPAAEQLVVRQGDLAPGTESGTVFGPPYATTNLFPFNGNGQVLVFDTLTGPNVNSSNNDGVWIGDREGDLQLLLRTGETVQVGSQLKTIQSIDGSLDFQGSGGEDGRRSSLNNSGQAVFHITCTDGVDYTVVATTPEPGSIALLIAGTVGLLTYAWRRCPASPSSTE